MGFPNSSCMLGLLRNFVEFLGLGESSLVDASWGLKVWRGGHWDCMCMILVEVEKVNSGRHDPLCPLHDTPQHFRLFG